MQTIDAKATQVPPPGFTPKTGVGHDGSYGDISQLQTTIRKLVGTMIFKGTLPVQSILNVETDIPQKTALDPSKAGIMTLLRPIHMYNAWTQSTIR